MIPIVKLISKSPVERLNNIKRFSGKTMVQSESVSEHSFWVAFFFSMIFEKIIKKPKQEDETLVYLHKHNEDIIIREVSYLFIVGINYALMHDLGEIYTGDLLHGLKYGFSKESEAIRKEVDKIEDTCLKDLSAFLFSNDQQVFKKPNSEIVLKLVKLSDWCSLYMKSEKEYKVLNNRDFEEIFFLSQEKIKDSISSVKEEIEKNEILSDIFDTEVLTKEIF